MEYEATFAERIGGFVKNKQGTQAYGRCCFHDDNVKSFSVNLITGQWYCHGCGLNGNAITFQQRLGSAVPGPSQTRIPPRSVSSDKSSLASNGQTPGDRKDSAAPGTLGEIVATYIYQYEDGSNAFRVTRYKPKTFIQHRWENGKWISGTSGIRRVPYRLPQILAANKTIYFVEGEKDVETLEKHGLIATTTPMGANSWDDSYAGYFRGKRVAVIPDNDGPGEAFAKKVAESISMVGRVKLLRLPGLPEKGDVSDFFAMDGNTVDELLSLLSAAPELTRQRNTQDPLDYFQERGFHIPDGKGALYHEFPSLCKDVFAHVTEKMTTFSDGMEEIITDIESTWKDCFSLTMYKKFLRRLKDLHEAGA